MEEENILALDDDEKVCLCVSMFLSYCLATSIATLHLPSPQDSLTYLDALTGIPHPEDLVQFALAVCAPYSAVRQYKFKAKLVPGTGKKGKGGCLSCLLAASPDLISTFAAIRSVIHHFTTDGGATTREEDVIKAIKDLDLFRSIPGKIKVTTMSKAAKPQRSKR